MMPPSENTFGKRSIPDNSPDIKELGGTGFPACAKNTLLFRVI
jgi:hypothetical protein